ncbi:MAG: thioredoxin family protein [Candidatus Sericytochromatia bacterium]
MHRLKLTLFFLLILGLPAGATPQIAWQRYDQGLVQARQSQKYVLMQFYADWCHYCHLMEKDLATQPQLKSMMQRHFVPVRIDQGSRQAMTYQGRQVPEKQLVTLYQVPGPPTLVILQPDGKVIARVSGMLDTEKLQLLLGYVSSGAYKTIKMDTYRAQQRR